MRCFHLPRIALTALGRSSCLVLGLTLTLVAGEKAPGEGDTDGARKERLAKLGFSFQAPAATAGNSASAGLAPGEPPDPNVIQMPRYRVKQKRIALTPDEVLTEKGKAEIARARYLNPVYQATVGPLMAVLGLIANPLGGWNPNNPEALALYYDQQYKERMNEMDDLNRLESLGKAPPKKAGKK